MTEERLFFLMNLRLRLQDSEVVSDKDLERVIEMLNCLDLVCDTTLRRSLILVLETTCLRFWHLFMSRSVPIGHIERALVSRIVEGIGSRVDKMQFEEHERWFGGVTPLRQTSLPHQNADKARLFCTLVICLALSQNGEEGDGSKEIDIVFKSLMGLYPSISDLARELLNSDDRFLATASALLALKKRLCDFSNCFSLRVLLAAFRDIQFDAKVLLDWVDGDELGFEAILAVIQSMTEDRKMWEKAVDPDGSESPPAKRQRLSSNCDAEFRTMYLEKKPAPSEDDIVVKVRVPYLEGVEDHHEETFTFSKKPVISTSYRLMLPKPDRSDFVALEEMMVELKLMLNKRLLEFDGLNKDTERLRDALAVLLGEEGDDLNDEEVESEEE